MPPILLTLLVIVLIVAVAVWLINMIPFPAGLEIIRTVLIVIVVVIGLTKLLALW
jgi:hypothetical protein